MKISIFYESYTGNTKYLADSIYNYFKEKKYHINYFGQDLDEFYLKDSDLIFVGFVTLKGSASENICSFLSKLNNKNVFLFGTAGFGEDESYFKDIIKTVNKNINNSNKVLDYFMCQGRMGDNVKKRYEMMLKDNPNDKNIKMLINNFNKALSHPNKEDVNNFKKKINKILLLI